MRAWPFIGPAAGSAGTRAAVLVVVTAAAIATGIAGCGSAGASPSGRQTVPPTAAVASSSPVPEFHSVRSYRAVAVPVRLRIPAIGVDTRVQRVGLAADGTVAPPDGWQVAGWYSKGPRPGQPGPAVIVGHVDSKAGPAVFYRLPELRRGDAVFVDRADGSSVRFEVRGMRQVAKARFPASTVYAPTLQASLRLLTCGGTFDASTGHYRDNIIVTAAPG
jgi:sortase (surface protein transpeptidase)